MKFFINQISITSIIPLLESKDDFMFIRTHLLNNPTIAERQITSRIAKTIDPQTNDQLDNSIVQTRCDKKSKWIDNLIIHYTHEARLQSYKKNIHQLWNQIFEQTPVINTKLIVGHRNNRNATKTFVHRHPQNKSITKPMDNIHQN